MLEQFNFYAKYYDFLYEDKDYKKEAAYVNKLIRDYNPKAKTILSLGCGTGKYEYELEKYGYEIVGVDISEHMIDIANSIKEKSKCCFLNGDIRNFRINRKFDIVISLFHVICYQTSNIDILNSFKTVYEHLSVDGIFIFDFWYGPAVLTDRPSIRVKKFENKQIDIVREARPKLLYNDNIVEVMYSIFVREKNIVEEFKELHRLRYLFLPELKNMLCYNKIKMLDTFEWLKETDIKIESWYGLAVCGTLGKLENEKNCIGNWW